MDHFACLCRRADSVWRGAGQLPVSAGEAGTHAGQPAGHVPHVLAPLQAVRGGMGACLDMSQVFMLIVLQALQKSNLHVVLQIGPMMHVACDSTTWSAVLTSSIL